MIKNYQVTLYCANGKYRPVSTIIKCDDTIAKEEIRNRGIKKICMKRYWTSADLKKYEYTKCKMREYIPNEK